MIAEYSIIPAGFPYLTQNIEKKYSVYNTFYSMMHPDKGIISKTGSSPRRTGVSAMRELVLLELSLYAV